MASNKKNKISHEDGADFMSNIEIQDADRIAVLETICVRVRREKRSKLFAKFDGKPTVAQKAKINKEIEDKVIVEPNIEAQLILNLQDAANSILFDIAMDKRRPTNGQTLEILSRIQAKTTELGELFGAIDNIAGKKLRQRSFDSDQISKLLLNVSDVIDDEFLQDVKKSKSLTTTIHPFRIMSATIIKALHEAGLLGYFDTDTKKVSFIEDVMKHLLELPEVEEELMHITGDEDYTSHVFLRDHILAELKNFQKIHKVLNLI